MPLYCPNSPNGKAQSSKEGQSKTFLDKNLFTPNCTNSVLFTNSLYMQLVTQHYCKCTANCYVASEKNSCKISYFLEVRHIFTQNSKVVVQDFSGMTNSHKCLYCKFYRLQTPFGISIFKSEKSIVRFILTCSIGYLSNNQPSWSVTSH